MPDRVRKNLIKDEIMPIPCNTRERMKESDGVIHGKRNRGFPCITGKNEFISEGVT
jgi:hypothetical protein